MASDIVTEFAELTRAAFAEPIQDRVVARVVETDEEWREILHLVHTETLGGVPPLTNVWTPDQAARFRALAVASGRPPCAHRLAFEEDGHLVGCFVGGQSDLDSYHMQFTGLRDGYRGRGIYARFLRRLIALLRDVGFKRAFSRHHLDNAAVLVPKLKAGFVIEGIEVGPQWGTLVRLMHPLTENHRASLRAAIGSDRAAPPRAPSAPLVVDEEIVLHPIAPADAGPLFALIDGDRARLRAWLPWVDGTTEPSVVLAFIADMRRGAEAGTDQVFAIRVRGACAGAIGAHRMGQAHRSCTVGYWLGAAFAGRGVMTRSCRRLLSHLFDDLGLNRVEISAAVQNVSSRSVPERLGFTCEGVRRDGELLNGELIDLAVYSMTAGDR